MSRRSLASHIGAFIAGGMIATAVFAQAVPGESANHGRFAALDTFAQSLSYIARSYVDPVDERKLIHGAIRGMAQTLDAHSAFLSPERYKELRQDTEGEFGGVGITLADGTKRGDAPIHPLVHQVVPGSPASRAGIRPGDHVLAIDGEPTIGAKGSARVWHARLRGLSGTRIGLLIQRSSWPAPRELTLVREQVKVPTVASFTVEPGIGYIAISRFQEATAADVTAALDELRKAGLSVLLLDLRGNPGGLLDQAIRVADLFLDRGTIVTIRGRQAELERHVAHAPGTFSEGRMIVLVDQGSASAAEIVAGALQENGRATILGLPSYGKGSVQTFIDLADGSGLKLTTARYYTPRDRSLEGSGIHPDIHVEAFAEEVIVAGSPDEDDAAPSEQGEEPAAGEPEDPRARLEGDHQFEMACTTARKWLRPGGSAAP